MTEQHTIPDDQMKLLAEAFDTAWYASLAWNRGMSAEPAWTKFLEKHGLTECYKDWYQRNRPEKSESDSQKINDPILIVEDTI